MSAASKLPIDTTKSVSMLYIDRIKREEDEDQWISGEELNTEGSSDEEDKGAGKGSSKSGRRHAHPRGGARPKAQRCKRPDVPPLVPPSKHKEDAESDSADEPIDISWKPKRGSIRLPHVVADNDVNTKKTPEALKE